MITKTLIKKILKQSEFDPRQNGPLSTILADFRNDPKYLEDRAIEFLREAQLVTAKEDMPVYIEKSQKAICLLVMARAVREI